MDYKNIMMNELMTTICRKSDKVEKFLRGLSTSKNINIDDIIHILRKILYKHQDNTNRYEEEYEIEYKNNLSPAAVCVIEKIFSKDYKREKQELILECKMWKEDRIVECFNSWRDFKDYLKYCCFTKEYCCFSQGLFYVRNNKRWEETNNIDVCVKEFVGNQLFSVKKGDKTIDIDCPSKWKETYEGIKGQFPTDPNFRNNMFQKEKGRTFHKNGAYNWTTHEFESNNYDTRIYINENFNPSSKYVEELKTRVFHPIFSIRPYDHPDNEKQIEIMEYYFYNFSQAISGLGTNKYPLFIQGPRDGGKGVLCKLTQNTFGPYVGTFQFCNLKEGKNVDSLRDNALWSSYDTKRIAQSCEEVGNSFVLDGAKIKRIFSGGDEIQFRNLYQESSATKIMPYLFSHMNNLPKISGDDSQEKINLLRLHTRFYTEDKFDAEYRNKYPHIYWVEEDESVEEFINRQEVWDSFLYIVIEASKKVKSLPQQIKEDKEEENETIDDVIESKYQAGSDESFIPYKLLRDQLKIQDSKKILEAFKRVFGSKIRARPEKKVKGQRGVWGAEVIQDDYNDML